MGVTTITLPISAQALWVILGALGVGGLTLLIWLATEEAGRKSPRPLLSGLIILGWVLVPIWLLLLSGTLWNLWQMLTGAETTLAGGDLGAGALIAAMLGSPFVIWGTVLKQRTVDFQKEGHITDRISKAVEHLGAEKTVKKLVDGASHETSEPNIEVRIGGILSLERIAQDSTRYDKGRDHVRCMEILCAYIRQNAPAKGAVDNPLPEWEPLKDKATEAEREAHLIRRKERFGNAFFESKAYQWAKDLPEPRADIALALRVIGRRDADQRLAEARWGNTTNPENWAFDAACPKLPDPEQGQPTSLAMIDTYREKLEDWKSGLKSYPGYRIDLRDTNLQGADLSDLVLSGARLTGSRMEGANLREARLEGANLRHARLEGAGLSEARMEGADLSEARMEGANLSGARMEGANLSGARMEGADIRAARMEGADLSWAQMEGADLSWARMEGADLQFSDLSSAKLSLGQLGVAFGDATVILPLGVTPDSPDWPAHWPKVELGYREYFTQLLAWRSQPARPGAD